MLFNYILGIKEIKKENIKLICRKAVRGIIFYNSNILMVHSNLGDYKFPGGGIDIEESHEEALRREVREETGYVIDPVLNKIGVVIERHIDTYDEVSIFEMTSYYYICKITDQQVIQELDDYENELEFKPIWINLDEAICNNDYLIKKHVGDINPWVNRETIVLKALKEYYADI